MRHLLRIGVIWLVASIIVDVIIGFIPIPSPALSSEAAGAHQTIYMLFYVGGPIFVFVWVLFLYNIIVFRRRAGQPDEERPAPPDSTPILLLWAGLSFLVVIFLAGWGTFTLHEITETPHAAVAKGVTPPKTLDIQVIGQEWYWTFRYPTYGAMETNNLYVPVNTPIHFHVTSLDVVHSLWIYNYGVKEDAVPGVSNDAYLLAKTTGSYTPDGFGWVKCNELCGIRHGYMKTGLYVMTQSAFKSWAAREYAYEKNIGLLKNLPKYKPVYYPASNSNWPSAPQDQSP